MQRGIRYSADAAGSPPPARTGRTQPMFSSKPNLKRRHSTFTNATGGPVGERFAELLANEPEQAAWPSSTEQALASAVGITASRTDQDATSRIQRAADDLRGAVAATTIALNDEARLHGEHEAHGRAARRNEQRKRQQQILAEPIDHAAPLISHRVLTIGEAVLLLLEIGFWYAVFSADIDRRVSWLSAERLSAVGLALFIPVLSIFAARLAGPAWQRALRYSAPDKQQRRNQLAAAGVSTLVLTSTGVMTGGLVHWRYSSSNTSNTFASLPPAAWMTGVFVLVVVLDALLRAFSDSEQYRVNEHRDTAVAADQREEKHVSDAVVQNKLAWADKYDVLQHLVNEGLDEIERIVLTGEQILLINRGRRADASATTVPSAGALAVSATTTATTATTLDSPQVGDATMLWHLDVSLLHTRLRVHATALRVLARYEPPTVQPDSGILEASARQAIERTEALDRRLLAFLTADRPASAEADGGDGGTDRPPTGGEKSDNLGPVMTIGLNGKGSHTVTI